MSYDDAPAIIDELFKEARSAFIAMTILSIFAGIALLSIPNRDLFVISQRIELPIVGAQMSIDTFFWIVPAIISLLLMYTNLLMLRIGQV